jgi:hypothetical protein
VRFGRHRAWCGPGALCIEGYGAGSGAQLEIRRPQSRLAATAADGHQHDSQEHDGKGEPNDRVVDRHRDARIREFSRAAEY